MPGKSITALSDGLIAGGVEFFSNFPGFFSHDIFKALGGDQISINERVAFETAYGASLAGRRSVVTMKNVGLNTCADPFLHSVISGINAGLVIIVTDDIDVVASQERQDSRHYFNFFGGLWFEPSSTQSAYDISRKAFYYSEKYDVPVVIRLTNNYFRINDEYKLSENYSTNSHTIQKNPEKYVIYPTYWEKQHTNLLIKQSEIALFVEEFSDDAVQTSSQQNDRLLVVVGSCDEQQILEKYPGWDILRIETYPIPEKRVLTLMGGKKEVCVIEHGDKYVRNKINMLKGYSLQSIVFSDNLLNKKTQQSKWVIWSHLEKLFQSIKNLDPEYVVGDVGQYTVESTSTIMSCLCLGSSIGVTLGLSMNGVKFPICVVGDTSILHSCTQALTEAVARKAIFGVIIIDNDGSAATGGQKTIADIYEINKDIKQRTIKLESLTEAQLNKILVEMRRENSLSLLYVKI